MSQAFNLPDLGEGIHEGEVLKVLVTVGDMVKEGDLILEVETDKAAVEIPSPYNGSVTEILAKAGDVVQVGDPLIVFDLAGDGPAPNAAPPAGAPTRETHAISPPGDALSPPPVREREPVPASPATRRMARELGVDLNRVPPTGPAGLVTAEDVKTYAATDAAPKSSPAQEAEAIAGPGPLDLEAPPLPDFEKWGPITRVPIRSIRRATARQMSLAWSQIPHVANQDEVDITRLEAFRQKHKGEAAEQGGNLTLTVFALKAAATALKAFPRFNATWDAAAGEIILKNYYHIGVAVDTQDGLIVPVIRDVDRKSIIELSIELTALVNRTRARKASLEEMQGGTFTITNAGPAGGGHFAPIINYPQVAILGMGQARLKPAVREGRGGRSEIVPRLIMPVVICFDHRIIDGADAINFLGVVINALEDPEALLMRMT